MADLRPRDSLLKGQSFYLCLVGIIWGIYLSRSLFGGLSLTESEKCTTPHYSDVSVADGKITKYLGTMNQRSGLASTVKSNHSS